LMVLSGKERIGDVLADRFTLGGGRPSKPPSRT
jgi:hypothetical protein